MLRICEKNSSVNLRFEIFVVAFRVRKRFGTFEKRAPGYTSGKVIDVVAFVAVPFVACLSGTNWTNVC